jgi:D-alanyl-lipoteichoic acid acyltransferase DltB (MBOAT superfamily)
VLAGFKYLPYIDSLFGDAVLHHKVLLSVGVSFYSFQAISYLIDVYLEITEPERHFGYFALYLSFFPKLLQGPIERAGNLLPQLREIRLDHASLYKGLIFILVGLVKKTIIADRIAVYVNHVYNDVFAFKGLIFVLATYLYSLQLYFDFSGYTDIALGVGFLFSLELTNNFNRPYFSKSISEFWRRWHISFSTWLMDYLFKPLQMTFRSYRTVGTISALMITFLISGVWHGSTLPFLFWGLLHGLYLSSSVIYGPYRKRLISSFPVLKKAPFDLVRITFVFSLVSFAWIFFRANNMHEASYIVTHLVQGYKGIGALIPRYGTGLLFVTFIFSSSFLLMEMLKVDYFDKLLVLSGERKNMALACLLVLLLVFSYNVRSEFMYQRF